MSTAGLLGTTDEIQQQFQVELINCTQYSCTSAGLRGGGATAY